MRTIPATLQTTYANLFQAHLNRPSFEFDGAPFTRKLNNKTYWYANHRTTPGAALKQRYLGPDTEQMRARIDEMRAQRQSQADFRDHASGLVAQLRAGGIAGPDRKTGPMLRALTNSGVFRLGGTLVGTHAFRHYDLVLGIHLSDSTAWITQTDDIDIASFEKLSMAIEDTADPDLADALGKLGFKPAPSLTPRTPTSWALPDASYTIDFLTPSFKDKEAPAKLAALNMWAQSLHFLNFLIADPIDAVSPYMEGLLVRIPRPERYAVHKLIISQRRRRDSAKARKDIEQARSIIWAMSGYLDHELKTAIKDADAMGGKWSDALDRALEVKFAPAAFKQGPDPDIMQFEGNALGTTIEFALGLASMRKLLSDERYTTRDSILGVPKARIKLEELARLKFRAEPAPQITITADEIAAVIKS